MGIKGITDALPGVPQVLVFDTAFHQTMPDYAWMYPIPYEMYEKYSIRRYGAHGTSHRYVAGEMCKILGKTEGTKIITCHIGNGSSISAVKDGKVIDTSMGFTPLDGVEMGTRCGSIDPAIVTFIMEHEGYTPAQMSDFMNKECGMLGVSGISSDSRDIEAAILKGDKRATLAANILACAQKIHRQLHRSHERPRRNRLHRRHGRKRHRTPRTRLPRHRNTSESNWTTNSTPECTTSRTP